MRTVDLDGPIRLDRPFWIIYASVGLPILLVVRPWAWDQPFISKLAGILFFPFATAIVVYCVVLVVSAALFGGAIQRKKFWSFLIVMAIVGVGMASEWALSGFKDSRWATPALASFAAISLYGALNRKSSDQPSGPTTASDARPEARDTHRF